MGWTLEPYIGNAENIDGHDFAVVESEGSREINERENFVIDAVKDGLEAIVSAMGGHLSVSAYGNQSQIPSPGDTTVIYISYVPDPVSNKPVVQASVVGENGETMSTGEVLRIQEQEQDHSDDELGEAQGLSVATGPVTTTGPIEPDGGEQVAEVIAVADPSDPALPAPGTTPDAPVTPSVPPELQPASQPAPIPEQGGVAGPAGSLTSDPTQAPVQQQPGATASQPDPSTLTPSSEPSTPSPGPTATSTPPADPSQTGTSTLPPSTPDQIAAPVADTPATPSVVPSDVAPTAQPSTAPVTETPETPQPTVVPAGVVTSMEAGATVPSPDDAASRVAAQLAENPVQPKPLYWPDQGIEIDPASYPQADVLAANGAILYNYANDAPGGEPTGAPEGGPWHVYVGVTQPAPGTSAAQVAVAQTTQTSPGAS